MKPRIGISACLLGEPVRYDGGHCRQKMTQELASRVELRPLCPETGAGLGVPRVPVRLVGEVDRQRMLAADGSRLDVTLAVSHWIERQWSLLQTLDGCILKARSPSCGLQSTPLFDTAGGIVGYGSGLFAAALQQRLPGLVLAGEEVLQDPDSLAVYLGKLS